MKYRGTVLLSVCVLLLVSAGGCSTCKPKCCAGCPPVIEIVEIPVVVHEPHPELPLADQPEITSAWDEADAEADPEGWLEALLSDFKSVINAWLEDRQTIIDANATRPPN